MAFPEERGDIDRIVMAHFGWAKGKACFFSRHYHLDFDDVFSYALESIWKAILYETEEGCDRNIRWFAAIFLKRRIIDMVRKAHMAKRSFLFEYADFNRIHAASVTFLTAKPSPFEPREPCIECGTTGGAAYRGRNYTARCRGYCLACYGRICRAKKKKTRLYQPTEMAILKEGIS